MRIRLGTAMPLTEIALATGGRINTADNPLVGYICTDSREVRKADLFIAIKGEKYDGEYYTDEARSAGAFVISSKEKSDIIHPDTRAGLLSLAEYYNKNLPYILYRIGITGSVGKTTTKEFLKILLSTKYRVHASEGNFNNEIGLPLSILSAKRDSRILLMEMGMNGFGEIGRLSKCLRPDLSIITNIGTAHIGNLGSRKNIAKAKLEITDGMSDGVLIHPYGEELIKTDKKTLSFSTQSEKADFCIKGVKKETFLIKSSQRICALDFSIDEEQYKDCLIAAIAAAMTAGLSEAEIYEGVSHISRDNIRQKLFSRENLLFYADYYNASWESVEACIKNAESLYPNNKKSLLLGDILELGDMSDRIHFKIGRSVSPRIFRNLFLFGSKISHTARGAVSVGFPSERIYINRSASLPELTADHIRKKCEKNEIIFMKGSRAMRLERILDCFSQ